MAVDPQSVTDTVMTRRHQHHVFVQHSAHGLCGAWFVRRLVRALIRLHDHPCILSNPVWGTLVGEGAIGWRNSDVNPYIAPRAFGVGLFARQNHLRVGGARKSSYFNGVGRSLRGAGSAVGSRLLYHCNRVEAMSVALRLHYERSASK